MTSGTNSIVHIYEPCPSVRSSVCIEFFVDMVSLVFNENCFSAERENEWTVILVTFTDYLEVV